MLQRTIIRTNREAFLVVAACLVAAGADVNALDEDGNSALMLACNAAFKSAATALLIVESGAAELDVLDGEGCSALDIARRSGLSDVAGAICARGGRSGAELTLGARL